MNGGRIIGRVVTANVVPNAEPSPELLQELNKDEEEPTKKLTTNKRQELLMQVLQEKGGLDMLKKWEKPYTHQARQLLMGSTMSFHWKRMRWVAQTPLNMSLN